MLIKDLASIIYCWLQGWFTIFLFINGMMASQQDMEDLKTELAKLCMECAQVMAELPSQVAASAAQPSQLPVYVTTTKLERFRGGPGKPGDLTVEDWVANMRGHLAARGLIKGKCRCDLVGLQHHVHLLCLCCHGTR